MHRIRFSREKSLVLISVGLGVFFALTTIAVRAYYGKERALAQEWSARGQSALRAGAFPAAVASYETALIYSPENASYQLSLAQALLGASRFSEAKAYLQTLWERQPGSGIINLELGRLALRDREFSAAIGYFHNAIFGTWEDDPEARRREARLELIQLLLDEGTKEEALGELISLAANLPQDASLYSQVGAMFLRADSPTRALQQFAKALQINPKLEAAAYGAGQAAFQMEDYAEARKYLQLVVRNDPANAEAAQMLATAAEVTELDPSTRGISSREKADRIMRGFESASRRLEACAGTASGDSAAALEEVRTRALQLKPRVRLAALRSDSDLETAAVDLTDQIELVTAGSCGEPAGADLALLLLARGRRKSER